MKTLKTAGALAALSALALLSSCAPAVDSGDESGTDGPSANCAYQPCFHGKAVEGEKNFATLINHYLKGKPEPTPWAGYWFPYTEDGIAAGKLGSPAGKYDAARGHKTNAQTWEIANHGAGVKGVQGWWGHCNGWCAAAALFPEPHKSATVNGIQFDVGDIKALLTEAGMEASADFYGNRVDYAVGPDSPQYLDTTPGQYFLILTNYIGKLKHPVLIDRFTLDQIWNQPLVGYEMEYPTPADYLGADPSAPGVYRINVTSTMWWAEDGVPSDVQTPDFNFDGSAVGSEPDGSSTGITVFTPRTLKMELWLDGPVVFGPDGKIKSSGNVIVTRTPGTEYFVGGTWRMGDGFYSSEGWPDYMWIPYSIQQPTDYANKDIDINWIRAHVLPDGGVDDPSTMPGSVEPPPAPNPSGAPTDVPWPFPEPQPLPPPAPGPAPVPPPGPGPQPQPAPAPVPAPAPHPVPPPAV